jgi:hypothetical protein
MRLLTRCLLLGSGLSLALACARPRPAFVEPTWGGAPAPAPEQIAEITLTRITCRGTCQSVNLVFRRDGDAVRDYRTGARRDSLFFARIDSVAFRHLANELVTGGFFSGRGDATGVPEPLASSTTIMSASILCRRFVTQWDRDLDPTGPSARHLAATESTGQHLTWYRCCGA